MHSFGGRWGEERREGEDQEKEEEEGNWEERWEKNGAAEEGKERKVEKKRVEKWRGGEKNDADTPYHAEDT